jgi:hypothetical protein
LASAARALSDRVVIVVIGQLLSLYSELTR